MNGWTDRLDIILSLKISLFLFLVLEWWFTVLPLFKGLNGGLINLSDGLTFSLDISSFVVLFLQDQNQSLN